MKRYLLSGGLILSAKVKKYTNDYVYLELKFATYETEIRELTRDSFNGLDKWVKENYCILNKL